MAENIVRYNDLGIFAQWRFRRAARMCGNQIKPWLEKRYGVRLLYSLKEIREAKREASLNDREVAVACGYFLSEKDFAEATSRFPMVLDQDDARRLIKSEVKNLTVLDITVHQPDGAGGRGKWDGGRGE
jgi:hypothetical protein